MAEKYTLDDWKNTIKREVPYVDIKPYSHNIISIALQAIAKRWGKAEANKCIRQYGLKKLGWKEVK